MSTLKTINVQHPTAASANIVLDNLGNVSIPTSGARITGDFSNATVANRVAFQTSTTNGFTVINVIPNGTQTSASIRTVNNSDPTNAAFTAATVTSAESQFAAGIYGTGTYLPMTFYTGGSERLRIDTSGNVGIGTSSPLGRFTSERAAASAGWVLAGKSAGVANESGVYIDGSNNAEFAARNGSGTLTARIGSTGDSYITGGNVGVGTSSIENFGSTSRLLKIAGTASSGYGSLLVNSGSKTMQILVNSDAGVMSIGARSNDHVAFCTNDTERARITSGGIFLVATSSTFDTVSSATVQFYNSGGAAPLALKTNGSGPGTLVSFFDSGSSRIGWIGYGSSSTSYNTTSDYRLKTNIEPLTGALERVEQLNVHRFNWLSNIDGKKVDGFIAHEVSPIVPEAVSGEKDAVNEDGSINPQGIDQSKLVPLLTAAIQELKAELDAVKAELATVKGA